VQTLLSILSTVGQNPTVRRIGVMKAVLLRMGLTAVLAASPAIAIAAPQQPAAAKSTEKADKALHDQIDKALDADTQLKRRDIDVDVNGGVVKLSGVVATEGEKSRAGQMAMVTGVTRVDNQLVVDLTRATRGTTGTIEDKTKDAADATKRGVEKAGEETKEVLSKTGEVINDTWITTKIKADFIGEDGLKGSDIDVSTTNHVVTLKGTVPTAAARDRALAIAKGTDGVRQVANQMTIAPKSDR
jgi:hyperosmotically inducible protein